MRLSHILPILPVMAIWIPPPPPGSTPLPELPYSAGVKDFPKNSTQGKTDTLLFDIPLEEWVDAKKIRSPSELIWDTEKCTRNPTDDTPYGLDWACWRHDFGLKNFKAQGRLDEIAKWRIDENLRKDLDYMCERVSLYSLDQVGCRVTSIMYYEAVAEHDAKKAVAEPVVHDPPIQTPTSTCWRRKKLWFSHPEVC